MRRLIYPLFLVSVAHAGILNFSSVDVPKTITPSFTSTSTLSLGGGYVNLSNLTVTINIAFPNDPALVITLNDNLSNSIQLAANVGASGTFANFVNTTFDDAAATPIAAGAPPFFGAFQPSQSIASLLAAEAGQTITSYQLSIANASASPGTLLSWSVSADPASVPEPATVLLFVSAVATVAIQKRTAR